MEHDTIINADLAALPSKGAGLFGRRLWRLWLLAAEFVIVAGIVSLLYWPVASVARITYDGPPEWETEVRSLVYPPSDGNILYFVPADAQARIEAALGKRGDVLVRISLPGTIDVKVTPAVPRLWTDGGLGIACDGSILSEPASTPELPFWRPQVDLLTGAPLPWRAQFAAAAWDELSHSDRRYEIAAHEWTSDPRLGWIWTASDDKTTIDFGRTNLAARAHIVSRLLTDADTMLQKSCVIDARFDGVLLLSATPVPVADSAKSDSLSVAAHTESDELRKTSTPRVGRGRT
jgi:hypothetical protein